MIDLDPNIFLHVRPDGFGSVVFELRERVPVDGRRLICAVSIAVPAHYFDAVREEYRAEFLVVNFDAVVAKMVRTKTEQL